MFGVDKFLIDSIENLRIRYDSTSYGRSMIVSHAHEEYEIYYIISGEREYLVDNKIYHVEEGNLVLINNNVIHRTFNANTCKYERICFYLNTDFIDIFKGNIAHVDLFSCFKKEINVLKLNFEQQNKMGSLIQKIYQEYTSESDMYKACIEIAMAEMLIFINRCSTDRLSYVIEHPDPKYKRVSDIITYINASYTSDINLKTLSSLFYLSISNLTKTFKQATGFTLIEYLNYYRITQAQRMLRETNLSISEISRNTGYSNITHFGRKFKEISGCSAFEYRKKHI